VAGHSADVSTAIGGSAWSSAPRAPLPKPGTSLAVQPARITVAEISRSLTVQDLPHTGGYRDLFFIEAPSVRRMECEERKQTRAPYIVLVMRRYINDAKIVLVFGQARLRQLVEVSVGF
jgi:hypothetical protein